MINTMIGLRAETSIHAGTGQNVGAIDLPIQREAHTDWPCVFGSAMKGALRNHAETRISSITSDWVTTVFGPSSSGASDHAGALAVTDARILLLPVRSLTGHFKWVTCPAVLSRLKRDLEMIGQPTDFTSIIEPAVGSVSTPNGNSDKPIFLEEFQFIQENKNFEKLILTLARFGIEQTVLENQLVVMRNDDFADTCRTATAITPHIAIDNVNKTVRPGALWYEETLPPETLLYVMLLANDSRKKGEKKSAKDIMENVTGMFTGDNISYLQLGGNETVGMGWCKVTVVSS